MSYPQPDADQYAINGFDFFRLNTLLASPGDIYESGQSGHAFALGPDSDIANVAIVYFDQQQPNFMNQIGISPDRSVVSVLNSNNLGTYTPLNRPAKILMWPGDVWNPDYAPLHGSLAVGSTFILETPRLDVIEYFQPQGALVPKRNDRIWLYQELLIPTSTSHSAYITIPFYGRKYADVSVYTDGGPFGVDYTLNGIDLLIGNDATGANFKATQLDAAVNITTSRHSIVNAATAGMFDLLTIKLTANGPPAGPVMFLKITTSDTPAE